MSDYIEHHYADLQDVKLHYVTAGEGPTAILLHGWPQTWYSWRYIIPKLAEHFHVIAPDLRGLGDSSRPIGGYDKKTIADDVWRLVHDVLGHEELLVVGHDWGGVVAFSLAAQHPEAVRRLVNFDVPIPGDGTAVMYENRWHHGLHGELDLPEALTLGREEVYLGYFYRNWGGRPDDISEEAQTEYLRTYRQPGAMRAGFNWYRAVQQDVADNEAFLAMGKLKLPVLCYGGPLGRGRGWGTIESWRRVAENVKGGIAENCGHWIPEERPDWAAQEIIDFFLEK